jgi:2-keto-4-pentenoate hydratase/2-oxohepta-3-ene-1,7-dioic acid hydratase in catechol pathway
MKLYTFSEGGQGRIGAGIGTDRVVDLRLAHRLDRKNDLPAFATLQAFIEAGDEALDIARTILANPPAETVRPLDSLRLLAPIQRPLKIRGFSVFERHLKQATEGALRRMSAQDSDPEAAYARLRKSSNLDSLTGPAWRATPGYYHSDVATVVGPNETVVWPHYSDWIDYELELIAVIGRGGKDIPKDQAMGHVFGYTIMNDLSARDAQFKAMATGLGVAKGKDFDGSNPMGPCIVTADEIPDPYALTLRTRVNGEEKSCMNSSEAYWTFADCIAYASGSQTIHPGEMFSTGCAPDCCSLELGTVVRRGDVIELEIEGIGVLRTAIS